MLNQFNLFQSVLLSTYFAVLCFQLAVVNGNSTHLTPSVKVTRPAGLNKGTDEKQMLGTRDLYSGAASKRANEAPTKAKKFSSSKPVTPSKVQLSMSNAVVKKKGSTANATKSSQGGWSDGGARNARGIRKRRTNFVGSGVQKVNISNNGTAKTTVISKEPMQQQEIKQTITLAIPFKQPARNTKLEKLNVEDGKALSWSRK